MSSLDVKTNLPYSYNEFLDKISEYWSFHEGKNVSEFLYNNYNAKDSVPTSQKRSLLVPSISLLKNAGINITENSSDNSFIAVLYGEGSFIYIEEKNIIPFTE